ncbi:hypothetical protein [Paenibacillus azoreducens]|uniref:WXG100 family type VII secretion target n=1 Tax=Paenibacillus azoreducens TaxID=116718 RepID=A0A919YCV1_9BACL|nr:hypothetical protein [Paenibacillus azoreducens]GIO46455.1 hypothetical protein J34TS1_12200 [Paenibacillus azoreducens]
MEILVELNDLEQAERELGWLLARIQADEQEARNLYGRLSEWTGQSANATRGYVEAFFSGLAGRVHTIEQQKAELIRYVQVMKQTDQMR